MSEKQAGESRTHKDSLFVDYFSRDRDWKQHFLSLYNALHRAIVGGGGIKVTAGTARTDI